MRFNFSGMSFMDKDLKKEQKRLIETVKLLRYTVLTTEKHDVNLFYE
jgi:hypothetical protein